MKDPKKSAILDEKDRILLTMLQDDAQLSLAEIGARLELTKMSISNRIKRLKRLGVLAGSHYEVNPSEVGQDYLILTQVTCEAPSKSIEKVANQIAMFPEVQSVYLTFGPYDIFFIARTQDREYARDFLNRVTDIHGVRNTVTAIPHTVIKESLKVRLEREPVRTVGPRETPE